MERFALLLASLALFRTGLGASIMDEPASCADPQPQAFPAGNIHNCPTTWPQDSKQPLHLMDVLPGGGFDGLRYQDMAPVLAHDYFTCRISNDGKYLLPDDVFLVPVKTSNVEVFAEYFDHWDNYSATTSTSFKAGAKASGFGVSVSGSFSDEHTHVKTHQVEEQAKTTRVQLRQNMYTVKVQPDSALHPTFKNRLLDIAANIQNNNTAYAHYLAEMLVGDFGTHYLTSVDAGAVLYQIDQLSSSYVASMQKDMSKVTASAGASFFSHFSFHTSVSHSSSDEHVETYLDSRTHSQIFTAGGPPFTPNMTIAQWEQGVPDNLAATDRTGKPLYYAVNPRTIPGLPDSTLRDLEDVVYKAVHRYYKVNTRFGCTNPNATNFDFQANVDDGSCNWPPAVNITFGGVFQKCQLSPGSADICDGGSKPVSQVNPLTGDHSCPDPYKAILLHSGTITIPTTLTQCKTISYHCGWWSTCHKKQCVSQVLLNSATYQAYWCSGSAVQKGYLFGGFYTSAFVNPITDSMSCPRYYVPIHFGEDIEVCVSSADHENAYNNSVPFGGFDSCKVGNPLAASKGDADNSRMWPHSCPQGYTRRLVTVDESCEINVCVKSQTFSGPISLIAPQLPPFRKRPSHKMNTTNVLAIMGVNGEMWLKNASSGTWEESKAISDDGYTFMADTSVESAESTSTGGGSGGDSLSSGVVAAISIVATLAFCTIIAIVFLSAVRLRKRKKGKAENRENYLAINEGSDGANVGGESDL